MAQTPKTLWTLALWLGLALASNAFAQARTSNLEAGKLAEATLGTLPGVAAVGILRGDRMEVAVRRREAPGAAITADAPSTPEPVFEIGSVSKVFTGLLVAQRVESGEWRLDQTFADLLPKGVALSNERIKKVTLQQLLTHTSCLNTWPSDPARIPADKQLQYDRQQLWSILDKVAFPRTPPCETKYSNFGYAILGELLAERSQSPWETLALKEVAKKASMPSTAQTLSAELAARLAPAYAGENRTALWEMNSFAGAGSLRSTPTDLLSFSKELLQGRRGKLGPASERLVTPLAKYRQSGSQIGYAVLLPTAPAKVWAHNGVTGGYLTEWVVWPESNEAVVILVSNNASHSHRIAQALVAQTWTGSLPKD